MPCQSPFPQTLLASNLRVAPAMQADITPPQHHFKIESILADKGECPLLEQLAAQLASAERTLAAQHASMVEHLQKHLTGSKPAMPELSPRVSLGPEFPPEMEPISSNVSQQRIVANQRKLDCGNLSMEGRSLCSKAINAFPQQQSTSGERPRSERSTGDLALCPSERNLTLLLPGQTSQEPGRSMSANWQSGPVLSRGRTFKDLDKLVLLPIWAERYAKRMDIRNSDAEVIQPLMDEPEEDGVHTIEAADFARHIIVHPMTASRALRDACSLLLVFYDVIMTPLGLFDLDETAILIAMQWIARIFWMLDIPMSFISGYVGNDGIIVMRPASIALRYVRTWFFMDLFVVSMDWVDFLFQSTGGGGARMGRASRSVRIVRMVRLLRLARMGDVLKVLLERLPAGALVIFSSVLKLFAGPLVLSHLVGCVWFAVGRASPADVNWIDKFGYANKDLGHQYIISLRWALSQLSGGMDEIMPVSKEEQIYAAIVFIISNWAGSCKIGVLTSHLMQLFIIGSQDEQQLTALRQYLERHRIPRGLTIRAQRNAQQVMNARRQLPSANAADLLDQLSHSLRVEVHFKMYFLALSVHPFFRDYMEVCPHVMRKICHAAVSTSASVLGDVIFYSGEASSGMLLVMSGCLKYTWGPSEAPQSRCVKDGEYVAEAALWVHWVHRGALTVVEDSTIFHGNQTLVIHSSQAIVGTMKPRGHRVTPTEQCLAPSGQDGKS